MCLSRQVHIKVNKHGRKNLNQLGLKRGGKINNGFISLKTHHWCSPGTFAPETVKGSTKREEGR